MALVAKTDLSKLKGISEKDRKQIEEAQEMLGPDSDPSGPVKILLWANFRDGLVFPFPEIGGKKGNGPKK